MKKEKQTIRVRTFINDKLNRTFDYKTTVYTRKDGTSYVNYNYNRKEVTPDVDGVLCLESRCREMTGSFSGADLMNNIAKKLSSHPYSPLK